MTNANNARRSNKTLINGIKARIATYEAELVHPLTIQCGSAAIKCVQESIDVWKAELARVEAA